MAKRRALFTLALAFAVGVCLLFVLSRLASSFLYYPTRSDPEVLARDGFRAESLRTHDGLTVRGLTRPPREPTAPWLLFFGGNAMGLDASRSVMMLAAERRDWGLAAFAYRGYDGSQGVPSEAGILADAEAAARFLATSYDVQPSRLVVVGQSLGSGVAAHVAHALAKHGEPVRGLVLLSPYVSMTRVFKEHAPFVPIELFLRDNYRTDRLAAEIPGPVVLVHGSKDALIPPAHSHELLQLFGARGRLVELARCDHNDLWHDETTAQVIRDLMGE